MRSSLTIRNCWRRNARGSSDSGRYNRLTAPRRPLRPFWTIAPHALNTTPGSLTHSSFSASWSSRGATADPLPVVAYSSDGLVARPLSRLACLHALRAREPPSVLRALGWASHRLLTHSVAMGARDVTACPGSARALCILRGHRSRSAILRSLAAALPTSVESRLLIVPAPNFVLLALCCATFCAAAGAFVNNNIQLLSQRPREQTPRLPPYGSRRVLQMASLPPTTGAHRGKCAP
jgi:hypothetical protein